MDDLDEMLLAVTDKSKNIEKHEYSGSDSGGGDSDYESEESARDDDDDRYDDGDDDMEPDDEDDDDYSVGNKRKKKKPARPAAKKARTAGKKKGGAKRNNKKKAPVRERAKLNLDDLDDDDEDEFHFAYDEEGYGDEADRARLNQMTEVERETELEDRIRRRAQKKELWEIGRQIQKRDRGPGYSGELGTARRSGRSRVNTKIAAMDDMLDKANKSKLADLSDADDEPDRRRSRDNLHLHSRESPRDHDKVDGTSSPSRKDLAPKQDRGRELCYNDLVKDSGASITTTLLFARRDALLMLSQRPGFRRAVEGLFVRVRVSGPSNAYLLCRVAGVETGKIYKVQGTARTDYFLILQSGLQKRTFSIEWCSGSHPTRHEFETYKSRLLAAGGTLPTRDELHSLYTKAEKFIVQKNPQVTDAERREHREHHERLYPEQVNWTVKRTEVQMALDVVQQDYHVELRKDNRNAKKVEKLKGEVEKLTADLRKCQAMEAKYVRKDASSNAKIFQELAAKNRAENRRMDRLAHTHKKLTAGSGISGKKINPYARFETTGMSYYSVGNDTRNKESKPSAQELKNDWRSSLKTWKFGDTKRTMDGVKVQKHFDVAVAGLDDLVWPPTSEMKEVVVKKYSSMDAVYVWELRRKKRQMEMRNKAQGTTGNTKSDMKDEDTKKTITFERWNELRNTSLN